MCTLAGGIQGPHVEDVNALHLSDKFQTLETGGVLNVAGDGSGLGTGGNEVLLSVDLCSNDGQSAWFLTVVEASDGVGLSE